MIELPINALSSGLFHLISYFWAICALKAPVYAHT